VAGSALVQAPSARSAAGTAGRYAGEARQAVQVTQRNAAVAWRAEPNGIRRNPWSRQGMEVAARHPMAEQVCQASQAAAVRHPAGGGGRRSGAAGC